MKRLSLSLTAVVFASFLVPTPALAQDAEAPPVVFGIYYRCSQAMESRADEIYEQVVAPIAQKHVDLGHLTGTLWLQHDQGGPWRRLWGITGTDLNQMLDMREAITQELTTNHAAEMGELQAACTSHDDYIWVGIENSPNTDPDTSGTASLSAYHSCDMSREARADEIFSELLAPLYQKHQDLGHLASWGYYSHRVGGIYRRLETMSGADNKTLLAMQDAIYEEAGEINEAALAEFRSICSWHSDYLWMNPAQQ